MPDELSAKLVVMDTGRLITLAVADVLDYLLYPGVPVHVPDAVLYEATRDGAALGAAEILAWVQLHSDQAALADQHERGRAAVDPPLDAAP